jgi:hypothetical protein
MNPTCWTGSEEATKHFEVEDICTELLAIIVHEIVAEINSKNF